MLKIIDNISNYVGRLLITHCGRFHADEIFATVILYLAFNGNVSLLRNDRPPRYLKIPHVVYDVGHEVGYSRYDHHQCGGNGVRANGIPYASAGLIWRDFGTIVLQNNNVPDEFVNIIWKVIDSRLIQPVDALDNGHTMTTECAAFSITKAISNFNPTWIENALPEDEEIDAFEYAQKKSNEAFVDAFEFAYKIFIRELERAKARILATPFVEKAIEESRNGIMILDPFVPWEGTLFRSENPRAQEILYVIAPSPRKGYSVIAVKKTLDGFAVRKPFPEAWAGQNEKILRELTGIESIHFCHAARFIAGTHTLEDAKKLAALAVSYEEKILYLKEG